jgi:hypothetical protein
MPRVKCQCEGRPSCRLCSGTKYYQYTPGPRGWMPFRCPTCAGKGATEEPGLDREKCPTCVGTGTVDPADPPMKGMLDVIWKAIFGA